MAGLVPAIHAFLAESRQDVDTRHKAGHDGSGCLCRNANCASECATSPLDARH